MPAELMKRAFNGAPPPTLTDALQQCCLRVPHDRESFFGRCSARWSPTSASASSARGC